MVDIRASRDADPERTFLGLGGVKRGSRVAALQPCCLGGQTEPAARRFRMTTQASISEERCNVFIEVDRHQILCAGVWPSGEYQHYGQ